MDQERSNSTRFIHEIRRHWESTGQASELLEPLNKQLAAFEAACEALQEAIVARGAAIAEERGQAAQIYDSAASLLSRGTRRLKAGAKRIWSRLPHRAKHPKN